MKINRTALRRMILNEIYRVTEDREPDIKLDDTEIVAKSPDEKYALPNAKELRGDVVRKIELKIMEGIEKALGGVRRSEDMSPNAPISKDNITLKFTLKDIGCTEDEIRSFQIGYPKNKFKYPESIFQKNKTLARVANMLGRFADTYGKGNYGSLKKQNEEDPGYKKFLQSYTPETVQKKKTVTYGDLNKINRYFGSKDGKDRYQANMYKFDNYEDSLYGIRISGKGKFGSTLNVTIGINNDGSPREEYALASKQDR